MRQTFLIVLALAVSRSSFATDDLSFRQDVAPILKAHCLRCHHGQNPKGDFDLSTASGLLEEADDGTFVVPGNPGRSRLLEVISGDKPTMPKSGDRLHPDQVETIRRWIAEGAIWPPGEVLKVEPTDWWSLHPLVRPNVPATDDRWCRTPVDAFLLEAMKARGLSPSSEADRRTLIRRVTFDLTGLPPTLDEISAFLVDREPNAYERLVDRLLESPRYGERWARHWLDVVRYADTHGYDKDQPRPNAWPYRDYVIRAFNEDKPYARFVEEQVAGDVLSPNTRDGTEALGFLSAGPWDFIGHAEVPETKYDGQVARLLDRDDMVSNTLNTFSSLTVQCARCHDHKFDPVSQEDYYSLQSVFAALDRADRDYDPDPELARRRASLQLRRKDLVTRIQELENDARSRAGELLSSLERRIAMIEADRKRGSSRSPAYGYHSGISSTPDTIRWVQVDLRESIPLSRVVLHPCEDDFNGIGPGFGFPVRFKVEASDDPNFVQGVIRLADRTGEDFNNPRLAAVSFDASNATARFVRITAIRLASRQNDFNFALAEVEVFDRSGVNRAKGAGVEALDSIEAPPRWRRSNLVDGDYPTDTNGELGKLQASREVLIRESLDEAGRDEFSRSRQALILVDREMASLPAPWKVYAGTVHHGSGAFRGTGATGGKPREIRVLARGDVRSPRQLVKPGTVAIIDGIPSRFELPADASEAERRAALAHWLTDRRNPLTWRSIVNRVWQYHFGRGLVDSANDFGRMGRTPSHPELLDWLATEFRDGGQSLKALHRLIVTSAAYRQSSMIDQAKAMVDADNRLLWRMNRRKIEAEEIRDTVLFVAGKLDLAMGGPGFRDFVVEHPEHSPHYEYKLFDPADPRAYRRSIYRFIVRSQPQPFLTTLDCADPSMSVEKRNESTTALQALALLNDRLMILMATRLAERVERDSVGLPAQAERAFSMALGRVPSPVEREAIVGHAVNFGLANTCRVIFNMNEFVFID